MKSKRSFKSCLLGIFLLVFLTGFANGQEVTITGKVTDAIDDTGLPGVSISVEGTTLGTTSEMDGTFTLTVPEANSVVVFSFIGYLTERVELNGQTNLNIQMVADVMALDELVVIGYGSQKRSDLTGAIAVVNTEEINKVATNDVTKALQGQVAGVQVQGSGEPGAAPKVKIRGIGSFGNSDPLYIIDGVFAPINDIPVSSIESIQVLKDGSAAAIYGSRAANGVIIITTKRGQSGDIKIDYSGYYGWQNVTNRYDVTNREQYQMLVAEATNNALEFDPSLIIMPANDPANPAYVDDIDTDWQDEVFKTGNITDHNLSFRGGNENSNFSINLNYFDQTSTVAGRGPSYTRYGVSINSDHKRGKFKFGESMHYTYADQTLMSFLHDGTMLNYTVLAIPTVPVYDESTIDGYGSASDNLQGAYTANVIGMNNLIESETDRYRFIGNVYGEYEFVEGLNYKVSVSYERTDWRDYHFKPVHDLGWFYQNSIAKMDDNRGSGFTGTFEQTLSYDKQFGNLKLKALIGQSALSSAISRVYGHAEGFYEPYFKQLSNGTKNSSKSDLYESRLSSLFGRLILNYNDKYMVTGTFRRDGSSRFSNENKFGNFPSVAAAWKLHNESFMSDLSDVISQLKLRGSYGILGNQNINDYLYQGLVNQFVSYPFNGVRVAGASQYVPASPSIKWETSISTNFGVDLGLFNNALLLNADYYIRKTEDLLYAVPTSTIYGWYDWESPTTNAMSLKNSGIEIAATYNKSKGDFNYSIGANITTLKNEVLSVGYTGNPIYGTMSITDVGGEVGEFYGWEVEKVFQEQTEINQLNAASPNGYYQEFQTREGDFKFKDLNGDGTINELDRKKLGSAIPNLYYGFNFSANYKGFDLSIAAYGSSGNYVNNSIRRGLESGSGWENYSTDLLDRWTPENPNTGRPRIIIDDPNGNNRDSDYWLEKGNYLRISNIELGYTVPESISENIKISSLRVYLSIQNAYTFTKYSGFDPDFNNDGLFNRGTDQGVAPNKAFTDYSGGLPTPRTVMVGVRASF